MDTMDTKALEIVRKHVESKKRKYIEALDMVWNGVSNLMTFDFDVFIVWKSKILQNCKYLISTNIGDGLYYELTYNGDRNEWYLDSYEKVSNEVIYNN